MSNNKSIPIDDEMLQAIVEYGANAQLELTTNTVNMDLGTIEFLKLLRRNYILDRLQLVLESSTTEAVQEFFIMQKVLDGQVTLLSYLIEIHQYNQSTNQEE